MMTTAGVIANREEPILSRLDRLDIMLRQLEDIKQGSSSGKSSCESTPSQLSSVSVSVSVLSSTADHLSPKSLQEKHCRPIQNVLMETDAKGTLIERLDHVEDRVLKLCMQLEEELERRRQVDGDSHRHPVKVVSSEVKVVEAARIHPHKKKGFKQLLQRCVTGKTS